VAQSLLLRLHDLPLGYRSAPASPEFRLYGCNTIEPVEPRPRLAAFLERFSPTGCMALYSRLFRVPGSGPAPLEVGTGAMDVGTVEGAEEGLVASRELLSHLLGDELPREVAAPETIGDATRLYRWEHGDVFAQDEGSSSFLVWRSGTVVASIFVAGDAAANDGEAIELARRQQKRIEAPTPYKPSEADETEVALEDPHLEVPVYWLGRSLPATHGLPRLQLFETASTTARALNAPRANLFYVDRFNLNHAEGIFLDLWARKQWRRLGMGRRRRPAALRCATSRSLTLPEGHAVFYAGFERVHRRSPCPEQPPGAHTARIYLPGVVVTATTTQICATCARPGRGFYNSFRGMTTIARGLELRPQPLRPATSP
jgi:hypothetical protein